MEYITIESVLALGSIALLIANIYVQKKGNEKFKEKMGNVNTVFNETLKMYNKLNKTEHKGEQPIEVLGLPVRVENALINNKIMTISDLKKYSIRDLVIMRQIGETAVRLITDAVDLPKR